MKWGRTKEIGNHVGMDLLEEIELGFRSFRVPVVVGMQDFRKA